MLNNFKGSVDLIVASFILGTLYTVGTGNS